MQPSAGSYVTLGVAPLVKGAHDLTLKVVGKAPDSKGDKIGFDSYSLTPAAPFPSEFYLLGPFDKANPDDIDTPLPPEKNLSLEDKFDGAGGQSIQWQVAKTTDSGRLSGRLDIGPASVSYTHLTLPTILRV